MKLEKNIMSILFRICENLSDLEDPMLNSEIFELMLLISEQIQISSPKISILFLRMISSEHRLDNILYLSQKWYKKKRFIPILNDLWRTNEDTLIHIIKNGQLGKPHFDDN
jgi:hypothetical protein